LQSAVGLFLPPATAGPHCGGFGAVTGCRKLNCGIIRHASLYKFSFFFILLSINSIQPNRQSLLSTASHLPMMADSGFDIAQLTEDQQAALQQFTAVTDQGLDAAVPLLQRCQWNVQVQCLYLQIIPLRLNLQITDCYREVLRR
jgi:hypothetical protein